jgi:hypothetical protein
MNKMKNIADDLASRGQRVRTLGDTLFVNDWGVVCSFTGAISIRNLHDSSERFGVGSMDDDADLIADNIMEAMAYGS